MGNFVTRLAIAYAVIFFVAWSTRAWTLMGPGGILLALGLAPLDWLLRRWDLTRRRRWLRTALYFAAAFGLGLMASRLLEGRALTVAAATVAGILAGLDHVYPREMTA